MDYLKYLEILIMKDGFIMIFNFNKMATFIRYTKYQKYEMGIPVDPPEYKQGDEYTISDFDTLEECEGGDSESSSDIQQSVDGKLV